MGSMIDFKRPDGSTCKGYLAEAGSGKPGIVVIQEWWGLNDQIKGVADRFAAAGYNALAPDLYKGRVTQKPDEANHMMSGLDFVGASDQDIAGAVKHLADLEPQGRRDGLLHGRRAHHRGAGARRPASPAACRSTACRPGSWPTRPRSRSRCRATSPTRTTGARRQVVNEFEKKMTRAATSPRSSATTPQHAFANENSPAYDVTSAKRRGSA